MQFRSIVDFSPTFIKPEDPAKIVKLASEYEVAVQQSVSLQCEAEGNPQPSYTWTPCEPHRIVCHESVLNIPDVLNDVVYSCKVTNALGTDTRYTSLGKLVQSDKSYSITLKAVIRYNSQNIRAYYMLNHRKRCIYYPTAPRGVQIWRENSPQD